MILNEETLKEIEELAGLFLDPEEIAVLMDLDTDELINAVSSKKGDAYLAYFRGKTKSKKEIHQNVVKMARHGSPQAEELAAQLIVKQSISEKRAKR